MSSERLDSFLVNRNYVASREIAQRVIAAGVVFCDGVVVTKASRKVDVATRVVVTELPRFVSRGGEKLQGAFDIFGLDVEGNICLDIGASTGGFTDCLLQHGASKVLAVDVGTNQLHESLQKDSRVWSLEQFNARFLEPENLPEIPVFGVTDVSFISLTLILPALARCTAENAQLVTLIKPQFEAGREFLHKGVVKDETVRQNVVKRIKEFGEKEIGLKWLGCEKSPLLGPDGNVEFLAWWRKC